MADNFRKLHNLQKKQQALFVIASQSSAAQQFL